MNDEQQLAVAERMGGLIFKYLSENITDDELVELHNWAYSNDNNRELFEEIVHSREFQESIKYVIGIDRDAAFRSIQDQIQVVENAHKIITLPVRRIGKKWYYYAAACVLFIFAAITGMKYFTRSSVKSQSHNTANSTVTDIGPVENKATLILGDGNRIVLDSAHNGMISHQAGADVQKTESGKIAYNASLVKPDMLEYNTLVTPRGGQYYVQLSDGTRVWLNAATTLRYPSSFSGKERRVELTGEAYFEVATISRKYSGQSGAEKIPFVVDANGMEVTVLGTHFNINSYSDEPVRTTTLLEGSVLVMQDGQKGLLCPGEQANIITDNAGEHLTKLTIDQHVDIYEAVSWKNGKTSFEDADLKSIMRKISRLYDVDITYQGVVPDRRFMGSISRSSNLSELLKVLELNKIQVELQGRKLIVNP